MATLAKFLVLHRAPWFSIKESLKFLPGTTTNRVSLPASLIVLSSCPERGCSRRRSDLPGRGIQSYFPEGGRMNLTANAALTVLPILTILTIMLVFRGAAARTGHVSPLVTILRGDSLHSCRPKEGRKSNRDQEIDGCFGRNAQADAWRAYP